MADGRSPMADERRRAELEERIQSLRRKRDELLIARQELQPDYARVAQLLAERQQELDRRRAEFAEQFRARPEYQQAASACRKARQALEAA